MRAALAIAMSVLTWSICAAQDAPSSGSVTNGTDKDFIEYDCRPTAHNKITCAMTQVKVRRMADPSDLAAQLAKIDERLDELKKKPLDSAFCQTMQELEATVRSGQPPAGSPADTKKLQEKKLQEMSPVERQDMMAIVSSIRGLCTKQTREAVAAAINAEHSKNSRTCKIWLNRYDQVFERQSNGHVWTSSSGPQGECGVVNISTLERPDPKWSLWNYRTRKVVTNKGGNNLLGMKCADLDESEQFFNWKLEAYYRGCDYVGFGAF